MKKTESLVTCRHCGRWVILYVKGVAFCCGTVMVKSKHPPTPYVHTPYVVQ